MTVLYGRLGLVAAFVLIAAVIAAPLLQRVWSPDVMIAQRETKSGSANLPHEPGVRAPLRHPQEPARIKVATI
ncbi:MAG TPA: hypothetical protein VK434_21510 [Microvirga sp.]|nr:hypothetical protein [Microvirga sp.]